MRAVQSPRVRSGVASPGKKGLSACEMRIPSGLEVPSGGIYLFKLQGSSIHLGRHGVSFLEGDPFLDALFEDVHGEGAAAQDFVVESANVKLIAELILGVLSQFEYFKLANFVAQCLRGPGDIAISFGLNVHFIFRGMVVEKVNDLLARPMLGMEAGVDDEADGTQHIVLKVAVIAVGILVKSEFLTETFGIERPAFGIGRVVFVATEERQLWQLLREGDLYVMAGNSFMIG